MYNLAIDLGSTCFKAAIFDQMSQSLGQAACYLEYFRQDGRIELVVSEVDRALAEVINQAIAKAGISPAKICEIGITSQAQTFMLVNKNAPASNFISWLDANGIIPDNSVFADFAEHSCCQKLMPILQVSKLANLKTQDRIKEDTNIVPLSSYAIQKLCGKSVIDNNLAAMSGLYSLKTGDWHTDCLDFLSLKRNQLPELIPLGSRAGNTLNGVYGLPDGIKVLCCGNDQTAGAFGAKLKNNDALITLGTGQVIYQIADKLPEPSPEIIRGPYIAGQYYRFMGDDGGSLISQVINTHKAFSSYDDFFAKAAVGGIINGFKNEIVEVFLKDPAFTAEDIAFSLLSCLCKSMNSMYLRFTEDGGRPETLYVTGGGCRNQLWLDLLERELDCKLTKSNTDPLQGVAFMINI